MTTLYIENASQSTQPMDSQKYMEVVPISMFGPIKIKQLSIGYTFVGSLTHA
jgi:hypothetical protein